MMLGPAGRGRSPRPRGRLVRAVAADRARRGGAVPARRRRLDAAAGRRAGTPASPPPPPARRRCSRWCCGTTSPTGRPIDARRRRPRRRRLLPVRLDHAAAWPSLLVALVTDDYLRREGLDGPEVYALLLVAATGGVVMGVGQRPDRDVPRPGDAVDRPLRAGRQLPPHGRSAGERPQVLRARRVLLGVLPLRHRPGLRRHRLDQPGTHRRDAQHTVPSSATTPAAGRPRPAARRASGSRSPPSPFHIWTPDVYQGAPTPVTVGSWRRRQGRRVRRAAAGVPGRAALLPRRLAPVVCVLAVLSMIVGSFLAVVQTDVKRMLAYSSINHAGFILVGVEAAHHAGEADTGSACRACWCTCSPTP